MSNSPVVPTGSGRLTRRFAALQWSFFSMYASTTLFSYLLLRKNTPTPLVGVLVALVYAASTLSQPLLGILCDRFMCHRFLYIISGAVAPLTYLWVIVSRSISELFFCAILSGVFMNSMLNMCNSWVDGLNRQGCGIDFGTARSFGSMSFAFMSIVFGWVVKHSGSDLSIIVLMGVFGLLSIVLALRVPKVDREKLTVGDSRPRLSEGLGILLRKRDYMLFVAAGFLAMLGLSGLSAYFAVYLLELGGDSTVIGIGNFTYAIMEVPTLLLFSRISKRFSFHTLFSVCLLAFSIQCLLQALAPNYVFSIAAMVIQGLSYAMLVPISQKFTAEHIDDRYIATAQFFSAAVVLSASMIFGSLLAGFLTKFVSLKVCFAILALVSFSGFVLYFANKTYILTD